MKFSKRVTDTPPYLFHMIDEKKKKVQEKGVDVISLAIGDPDQPTPEFILKIMEEEIRDPKNHVYPSYKGEDDFCDQVASWFEKRFEVKLDSKNEIMATIGAKDAVSHLPFAFLDPGDSAIVTDPGYPVYDTAIKFSGASLIRTPLLRENSFLPNLDLIDSQDAKKAKFIIVNYPNNPTAAVADKQFFQGLVEFAAKHDLVVIADNAYSEVYFEEADKPISIMEIPGAKDHAIEIHSFSKTFNMTGWRIGFVVGGKELIDGFLSLKSNFDSGVFMAVQRTAARALHHPEAEKFNQERTALFKARRDRIASALDEAGFEVDLPRASYYFWVPVPENYGSSIDFCADLLEKQGVSVTPGVGYGPSGEKFFRISMTAPDDRIDEALKRLRTYGKNK